MKYIIGLGNPGLKYRKTRHNAGFMTIDAIAKKTGGRFKTNNKFEAKVAESFYEGEKLMLIKPMTFMNHSGYSVSAIIDYFKIDVSDMIVIYDDMDLPVGSLRIKEKGSGGSHNGMKSIIGYIKSEAFPRIRMGIGKPQGGRDTVSHVLGKFGKDEAEVVNDMIIKARDAALLIVSDCVSSAQQKYNG